MSRSFDLKTFWSWLSRAPRAYWGVLGPYAMFKNRTFYKSYVQKPYVLQTVCSTNPMLCSRIVCSTNPMLYSKTVCSTNAMFKNRMFYKPYAMLCYAMLCYVQRPYVLQTLCYVQKLYVLQTLCSTNRAFSRNSFLENIWSPHLAKQRSGEHPRTPVGLIARALYCIPRSRTSTKCGVLKL